MPASLRIPSRRALQAFAPLAWPTAPCLVVAPIAEAGLRQDLAKRVDSVRGGGYNLESMSRRNRPFLPLLVFLLLISPIMLQLAYGYLDPGTGSYIIQLLIGGLLGGIFAIGVFWKKVVAFVKRIFRSQKDDAG